MPCFWVIGYPRGTLYHYYYLLELIYHHVTSQAEHGVD